MTIDWSKPIRTRDGHPVEIITTEARGPYPMIGYIGDDHALQNWTPEGQFAKNTGPYGMDLINVPEECELWLNVYERGFYTESYTTKQAADADATEDRIACVHVKYKVGEGLE